MRGLWAFVEPLSIIVSAACTTDEQTLTHLQRYTGDVAPLPERYVDVWDGSTTELLQLRQRMTGMTTEELLAIAQHLNGLYQEWG